jgi:DnaJ homolog subfamily C member 17
VSFTFSLHCFPSKLTSYCIYLAKKFHELNQAYELLLDPLRRLALDAKLRLKYARAQRYAAYDNKRKNMLDELEQREREFKKAKMEKDQEKKREKAENERIQDEGKRMREERQKQMEQAEEDRKKAAREVEEENAPPPLGIYFILFDTF